MIRFRSGRCLLTALLLVVLQAASAGAVFDDLEVSPRARGLGGCYAGLSSEATGVFYNPAGLVNTEGRNAYLSMFRPFDMPFSRVNLFAYSTPVQGWGTVGVGYSDFRVDYLDTVLEVERTLTFSHAFDLMRDLSSGLAFGYSVNIYNLDYPTVSVTGFDLGSETTVGLDIGFVAQLRERTTAGFFVENLNNPSMGDPVGVDLPQRVSGGMAYRPYDGVITAFEVEKQLGQEIQFHGGMEFEVSKPLVIRVGAQTKPNLLDVGVGLNFGMAKLDVTYTHHPVMDATIHYGLGLHF
ncbi:MAG: hypothetical protein QF819_10100 [Gemmatimonadota bacterium]|nr:hypothetical protein [Gemmatimonadota bacterium]MDP6803500.1 hypothetical protein [Gemmatimonadota bacterium]MDP7031833.1 hypothetical protein [Gemmatimonadota bacterium]